MFKRNVIYGQFCLMKIERRILVWLFFPVTDTVSCLEEVIVAIWYFYWSRMRSTANVDGGIGLVVRALGLSVADGG